MNYLNPIYEKVLLFESWLIPLPSHQYIDCVIRFGSLRMLRVL